MGKILKRGKRKRKVDKKKRKRRKGKIFKVLATGAFFVTPGGGIILVLFHGFKALRERRKKNDEGRNF